MVLEDRWLRETYVDLLIEYAAKNKDIVILEADLMKAGGTFRFAEKYPERTFDVGIQEAVEALPLQAVLRNVGKCLYVSNGQNSIHPYIHSFCHQTSLRPGYPVRCLCRTERKDDGKRPWCNSRVQRRNPHEHGRCFHYEKYSWNDCLRAS